MKKMYIICFLLVSLLGFSAYKISYKTFSKNPYNYTNEDYKVIPGINDSSVEVCNLTKLYYETYNINTGEVSVKEKKMPVTLLGCNINMVREYYKNKTYAPNVTKFQIIEFTKEKLTVRASIAYEINERFFVKLVNETLVIYENDLETVYDYAYINYENLPQDLKEAITQGFFIKSEEDLYDFLHNYSS